MLRRPPGHGVLGQRTGTVRPLAQRVDDLDSLTDALGLTGPGNSGPIISVAHDWGGPISLGWVLRHLDQMAGVVLSNTAVHQPANASAPTVIRAARLPGMLPAVTSRTRTFIRAGLFMSRPVPPPEIRAGYYAPYSGAGRRDAIEDFVADIPLDLTMLARRPWTRSPPDWGRLPASPRCFCGPRDPVFSDLYLRDLIGRLPHADATAMRAPATSFPEDAPTFAADVATWVRTRSLRRSLAPTQGRGWPHPPCPTPGGRCGRGSPSARPIRPRAGLR